MMLRILGMSTPMPNALVAAITGLAPMNRASTPALSNCLL
jgi:hypothetical protein